MAEQQEETQAKPRYRGLKIAIGCVVGILAAAIIAFGIYVGDYYHADNTAQAASQNSTFSTATFSNAGQIQRIARLITR